MTNSREHWSELARLLLKAFGDIGPALDPKNRELIADFIENREFEVAYRWMTSAAEEQQIETTDETNDCLRHIAALIGA